MIYFLTFALSALVFSHACKQKNIFLLFFSLFFPCLLAGMRDEKIGLDVITYVSSSFDLVKGHGLIKYLSFYNEGQIETGYLVLVWLISSFIYSQVFLMFVMQLIILLPYYLMLYKSKSNIRASIYIFIFLLFMYNTTLCVIRQSMAVSLIFSAFYFFERKRFILATLLVIWGISTHNSAFLLLAVMIFLYISSKCFSSKRIVYLLVAIGLLVVALANYIFLNLDVLAGNEKYLSRLEVTMIDAEGGGGYLTSIFYFITASIPLILFYIGRLKSPIYGVLPFIGATLSFVFHSTYFSRLALLFMPMLPVSLYYTSMGRSIKTNIFDYILFFLFVGYWIVSIVLRNDWDTYPYVFG